MRKLLASLGLSLFSLCAVAGEPAAWSVNRNVLSCTPNDLPPGAVLWLSLAAGHGQELAVRRLADDTWFFLVVDSPPLDQPQLMSTQAFASARRVAIPAHFIASAWGNARRESVFSLPGRYEIYVSNNLESEAGGYKCAVKVRSMSPNNSFKPKPRSGSA